ncbi:MAG TPA: DUF512 domain-containing protein [Bacillota bacterium]|nr:DUF512 domain-containing protein [Bacillota bacterium]
MALKGGLIARVEPGSIGEEMGLIAGDCLTAINGQPLEDLIDYRFMIADEYLEIEVLRADGEEWLLELDKEFDEDLGLEFEQSTFDGIRSCRNKCVFCFVDQMPPGMRKTLYVKDDDYRMSFLHGNFITFTNVGEEELSRIIRLRLSPLYISVHTTNPELRSKMLHNPKAGQILEQVRQLVEAGIEVHTQVVVCPGYNDGAELERTLKDLAGLFPGVCSVAVVPVGVTAFRKDLPALRLFNASQAAGVINLVEGMAASFRREHGISLVYVADEFYVLAGKQVPPCELYDEFPQLENGVGLVRLLLDSWTREQQNLPQALTTPMKFLLVTGKSAQGILEGIAGGLKRVNGLEAQVVPVSNSFFGDTVTVAGLVTGGDIITALQAVNCEQEASVVCIPSVMLNSTGEFFLDGRTPAELQAETGFTVQIIDLNRGVADLTDLVAGWGYINEK